VNGYGYGGGRAVRVGSPLTEGVKYLLIWNGIFYLLQHFIVAGKSVVAGYPLEYLLGIVPVLVWKKLFVWQLFSYMFLHGGLFHILFNMFALWMFGGDLERMWGTRRFITYYFFTGVGAGLMTVLFTPNGVIPTIGASGAIYGLLLAYALYFPERRVFLYFLIPVPVRIFVLVFGLIALLSSITSAGGGGIAHLAHLGGLVFGWIYLKWAGGAISRWQASRRRRHLHVVDSEDDQNRWWNP
jgi:membrane associated rhomboid family serine protease